MKLNVVDQKGNKVEEITLKDTLFKETHLEVLKQYLRIFSTNQRQGTSSTKDRGEVSGGGRKPWNQKGTGRARVGSTRSPIWVHGGTAFGPKPKDWSLNLTSTLKSSALQLALSLKAKQDSVYVLDALKMEKPSTKEVADMLKSLKLTGTTLLVWSSTDESLKKSVKNLKNLDSANAHTLNAFDVVRSKNVIFMKDAILEMEKKYENK